MHLKQGPQEVPSNPRAPRGSESPWPTRKASRCGCGGRQQHSGHGGLHHRLSEGLVALLHLACMRLPPGRLHFCASLLFTGFLEEGCLRRMVARKGLAKAERMVDHERLRLTDACARPAAHQKESVCAHPVSIQSMCMRSSFMFFKPVSAASSRFLAFSPSTEC